jgi:hypothetical protein
LIAEDHQNCCLNKIEYGDINDIQFSQDINISHTAEKRPLEWLLDKHELKLTRLSVEVDKNGYFRTLQENDIMRWMTEIRLFKKCSFIDNNDCFYRNLYVRKILHWYTFLRPIFKFYVYHVIDFIKLGSRDMFVETPCIFIQTHVNMVFVLLTLPTSWNHDLNKFESTLYQKVFT